MTFTKSLSSFRSANVVVRFSASKKPELDLSLAEAEGQKAEKRLDENRHNFKDLKKLGMSDRDKYGKGVQKLVANGDQAAKAAETLYAKYHGKGDTLKGKAKRSFDSALEWLDVCVNQWQRYKNDFGAGSSAERLANQYASAQQLEAALKGLPSSLKGQEKALDESWRDD